MQNYCTGIFSPGYWKNYQNHYTDAQFYALLKATQDFGPTFAGMSQSAAISQAVAIMKLQGFYYVRYVDPQIDNMTKKQEEGFLSKLMFWRSTPDPKKGQQQYRIYVKGATDSSEVLVLSKEGGVDKSDSARKILTLLHEQLK